MQIAWACASEVKAQQKGQLAAVFDTDEKLLFARLLEEPDPTTEKLASIADQYTKAQSGDAEALVDLGKVTLISGNLRQIRPGSRNRAARYAGGPSIPIARSQRTQRCISRAIPYYARFGCGCVPDLSTLWRRVHLHSARTHGVSPSQRDLRHGAGRLVVFRLGRAPRSGRAR